MQQPKLTFIHGFMGYPGDWDEVRAALPEYETSAIEIKPAVDWQSSIEQVVASAPDRSVLVGYSMGARLALGVALEFPQRCAGLVFVSGNPGLESEQARKQRREADEQIAKRIEAGPLEIFLREWYQSSVFATLPEAVRYAEIQRKLSQVSESWPAILRANSVSGQPNYWSRLSELSIPTVVVAGELDEKYRKIAVRFENEFKPPTRTVNVVPECGHIVHREQPTALIQIIREFVEGQKSQPEA